MPYVTVGRENSAAIRIYYEDHGSGPPVVLVHGYALNGHSWEKQEAALLAAGHRVITYDRRGFGASSRPSIGYDFDTLAGDLHVLLSSLDLHAVVLAGFAMGTGEVARHLAVHGSERVRAAVLVAPMLPFLLKTPDNRDGIDRSVLDTIAARIAADRPAAMKDFMDRSYNVDLLGGGRVSDQAWQNSFYVALSASANAAVGCVTACLEDFRADLASISIPVLVIHGDQDRVLPYEVTSRRLPALLKDVRSTVIAGGPHAIIWTHADEVNHALLDFIQGGTDVRTITSPVVLRRLRLGRARRVRRRAHAGRSPADVVAAVVDAHLRAAGRPAGGPALHPHPDPGRRRLGRAVRPAAGLHLRHPRARRSLVRHRGAGPALPRRHCLRHRTRD